MLKDPVEIEIISQARQKNVRDPKRSRDHFERIFSDFFSETSFDGKFWLDLGPGQYDFGELARMKGAIAHGLDNDEAVIKLGQYKKFKTVFGNLKNIADLSMGENSYDGLFCKFSINAFWFAGNPSLASSYVEDLCSLLKPNGSAWIAPWNGMPKNGNLSESEIKELLEIQKQGFSDQGFSIVDITVEKSKYYGVNGTVANNIIFTKNL